MTDQPALDQLAEQAAKIASSHGCFGEADQNCCDRDDPLPLERWCPECVLGELSAAIQVRQQGEAAANQEHDRTRAVLAGIKTESEALLTHFKRTQVESRERREALEQQLEAQREQLELAQGELRHIDCAMARRPALDKPTRVDNILHAISVASLADSRLAKIESLEQQLAQVTKDRDEAIESFYAKVNARAEADMLAGNPVTGAHHRALEVEIAAYREQSTGGTK